MHLASGLELPWVQGSGECSPLLGFAIIILKSVDVPGMPSLS